MTQTFIPGKDAALESTLELIQAKLAARGFIVDESPLLHDIDGVWSLELRDRDCPLLVAYGKGATALAARASAYGEFAERLGTGDFWRPYYLGATRANKPFVHGPQERWFAPTADGKWPAAMLDAPLHQLYNPHGAIDGKVLVDRNSGNGERGICTLPYTRVRDGAIAYIPVNIVGNLYGSNGTAAGNTLMEARSHAMAEIFERAIGHRIAADGLCLPDVPDDVLARFPVIATGVAALRGAGFGVLVKDASLGGRYPVANVTLIHPHDQGVLTAYGAHPRFAIALERAMTALLGGRPLATLAGWPEPEFDDVDSDDCSELAADGGQTGAVGWNFLGEQADYPFVDWNFSTTTQEDYDWLVAALHGEDRDLYVADFSALGVYSCRILVPGWSELRPVADLEWENDSIGNDVRAALAHLHDLTEKQCASLLATLQTLNVGDGRLLPELLGLAAAPGTPWERLRMGELKTLLALAVGDEEAVLAGCDWLHHYADLEPARLRVYRCIEAMLRVEEADDYGRALTLLYGADTVRQAGALLGVSERFFGLGTLGADFEGSALHASLLAAYDKLGI